MKYTPVTHMAPNNYCPDTQSKCAKSKNDEPSLTQQHFKDEVDTTNIVNRFMKTGLLPQIAPGQGMDMTNVPDFQDALDAINEGKRVFMALPDAVLARFNRDPNRYLHHMDELARMSPGKLKTRLLDELRDLGLDIPLPPPETPPPGPPAGGGAKD